MDKREELTTALVHVERGAALVQQQKALIARLSARGLGLDLAHELLARLELTLDSLRYHRDLIRREIEEEAQLRSRRRPGDSGGPVQAPGT